MPFPQRTSDRTVWRFEEWHLRFPFQCVTVHLSVVAQVIWLGIRPSSTRFPAIPHPSGPSRALPGSLGDQVHLEPLETKDPQVPQASRAMQVCRGPQENEVSWASSLTGYPQRRRRWIRVWPWCLYSDRDWNSRARLILPVLLNLLYVLRLRKWRNMPVNQSSPACVTEEHQKSQLTTKRLCLVIWELCMWVPSLCLCASQIHELLHEFFYNYSSLCVKTHRYIQLTESS